MKKLNILILSGLIVGILYQSVNLGIEYGPDVLSIRRSIGKLGQWRGANFNQSQKVADYLEFLNQNIPENARVILPSYRGDSKVLVNPYMQFYLAPREVFNCLDEKCILGVYQDDTYILIVGDRYQNLFPEASYIMFDEYWGFIPPENHSAENLPELFYFKNVWALFIAGIGPILWTFVATLIGTAVIGLLNPGLELLLTVAFGYGLGFGLISLGISILSLLGFQINRTMALVIGGIFLLIWLSLLYVRKRHIDPKTTSVISVDSRGKLDILPIMLICLGGIVFFLAIGKGYHRIDAIQIWGVKGYGIAIDNTIKSVTNWGTNTLPYPLHIPVLIAIFRILFGDVLPSSKLIFGGYFLSSLLVGYFVLIRMGVKRWLSFLAVFLLFTSPIIFRHGTIGYANLPLAYYLLSGVVMFLPVFVKKPSLRSMFLSGLFFAIAAWTRPEGLMLAVLTAFLLLFLTFQDKNVSLNLNKVLAFLAPIGIYVIFWQVINMFAYTESLSRTGIPKDALFQILGGELHFKELLFISSYLGNQIMSLKIWGLFGVILLAVMIIILIYQKFVSQTSKVMIKVGGVLIILIIGMYYLTSFDSAHDLSWWVTSGLNRMIFPGMIVLWLGIVSAFHDIQNLHKGISNK